MESSLIATVGEASQLKKLIKGTYLHGFGDPRVALVGRSNVGKSSIVNALVGNSKLARVSKEPGKTRTINFYRVPDLRTILVDLPGYGFAKAAHGERERWAKFIHAYLTQDPNLRCVFQLLDAVVGPTQADADTYALLRQMGLDVKFVFTKVDRLKSQKERAEAMRKAQRYVDSADLRDILVFWVSSHSKAGLKELQGWLAKGDAAEGAAGDNPEG